MKPKTLILMVLAIGCGLGASFMTSRLLAERGTGEEVEKVPIVYAKKRLDVGLLIKKDKIADMFEIKMTPKEFAQKDAFTRLEDLDNRILKKTLNENAVVVLTDAVDKNNAMVIDIPKGHRAVGLRVNMESSAHGFATLPGNRVDIIGTFRRATDKTTFSRVLLEDVLVLAADADNGQREGDKAPRLAQVVTFALTQQQTLQINMAKELGSLSLALRSPGDKEKVDLAPVTAQEVLSGRKFEEPVEELPAEKPAPPPPPVQQAQVVVAPPKVVTQTHKLHIIEGDKERVVEFVTDKEGKPLKKEVRRTELNPAPVNPPPAVEPQQAPPQAAAPAPKTPPQVEDSEGN